MIAALVRVQRGIHAWLVALDQLAYVSLAIPKYVCRGGEEPSAQETISSKIGRMAIKGHCWALIAEPIVNRFMELWGASPAAPGHCRRAIVAAEAMSRARDAIDDPR
ncbi:hypothetical protein FHS31_000850 [Sphingomonas vulcanisoli]|uniref:Transposase n=1 Tax=Sphingomonas vulcanisoli TaxID=1658060 RepID=A0ABX0TP00_9SPHN|nr:hypothetical protein [Sphingomonas vulcanisoli]NIJ07254.1 hypothetical protein [Sphingomonas vulcanisoli]